MTAAVTLAAMGNGPAFSAYPNTAQNITTGTNTKIQFSAEVFDTNGCYDPTTNYRFTPTVAGYYQVSACVTLTAGSSGINACYVYKNGTATLGGQVPFATGSYVTGYANGIVYLNGSTDYVEVFTFQNSGSTCAVLTGRPDLNSFNAAMVRGA